MIVVGALLSAATPLIYRGDHRRGDPAGNTGLVVQLAVALAALALAEAGFSLWQRWISARIGEGLIFDMRTQVFAHFQRMPIAFFTRTQTGALVSRLNNDVMDAQRAFTDTFSSVVGNVIGVVITLVAMALLSWQITLIALVLLPVIVLPARWVGRRLQAITLESYNLNATMTNTMVERFNVAGALLVKLFGRPAHEIRSFEEKAGRVRDIGVTRAVYTRVFSSALVFTAALATALVYGWGGVLAATGALQVGTLVALTAYLNRLYGPLTALSNVQVDIMTALISFERVFEVLDLRAARSPRRPTRSPSRGAPRPSNSSMSTSATRAPTRSPSPRSSPSPSSARRRPSRCCTTCHSRPSRASWSRWSVRPERARPPSATSSRGSTTFAPARSASMAWTCATPRSSRSSTSSAWSPRTPTCSTTRSGPTCCSRSPTRRTRRLVEALRAAQILPLVESLPEGLDTLVGDRGYRLSGGEKQRLAIARLLLKAPDVVVLDEATAHLDSESELAVQLALNTALVGRTSIVIAHRLSTVREAAQILVIAEGRIVERGTHADLIATAGLYSELYRTQFEPQAAGGAVGAAGDGGSLAAAS